LIPSGEWTMPSRRKKSQRSTCGSPQLLRRYLDVLLWEPNLRLRILFESWSTPLLQTPQWTTYSLGHAPEEEIRLAAYFLPFLNDYGQVNRPRCLQAWRWAQWLIFRTLPSCLWWRKNRKIHWKED
jgi:hypothetical protein